jgi:hypothetical protein
MAQFTTIHQDNTRMFSEKTNSTRTPTYIKMSSIKK